MKKNVRFYALLEITLAWIILILGFSSQSGEESGGLSAIVSEPVTNLIAHFQGGLSADEEAALYLQVDGVVRVMAHFSEFAVLGAMLTGLAGQVGLNMQWIPWSAGLLIAVLDEWRQSFSPGRVSDPMDVVIDVMGVIFGSIMIKSTIKYWRKKHVYHS